MDAKPWILMLAFTAAGCYEPLPDPCDTRECGKDCGKCPEGQTCTAEGQCTSACEEQDCGISLQDESIDCGNCPGDTEVCTESLTCIDDCAGRECGPSPVGGFDCGTCPGGSACSPGGTCGCQVQTCADGHCPAPSECCTPADCGAGGWTCTAAHQCDCAPDGPCSNGFCPEDGGCCTYADCAEGTLCIDGNCRAGAAGDLVLDGAFCTLDGMPCQATDLQQDGPAWNLVSTDLVFVDVHIRNSAILTAPAYGPAGSGGRLTLSATGVVHIETEGSISMSGKGYGGGGGGGGRQYCDSNAECEFGRGGGPGHADPDGQPGGMGDDFECPVPPGPNIGGYRSDMVASGAGGAGGGHGGERGHNGGECTARCSNPPYPIEDGAGGAGGGPFGGAGGVDHGYSNACGSGNVFCDGTEGPLGSPTRGSAETAESGERGGYAAPGGNGDTTEDTSVSPGSGGGGGAGGIHSSGWCCGGGDGGHGGVTGAQGGLGCTGGGGGGGGGAGGGAIDIQARGIIIDGSVTADGAGQATLFGGYGAGGGILLHAREGIEIGSTSIIRTLGGFGDGVGSPSNGGTIKLFYGDLNGTAPGVTHAGRVFERELSE